MGRFLIAWLLLLGSPAQEPQDAEAKLRGILEESKGLVDRYLAGIDRTSFDLDALKLESDPDALFAFVRDRCRYETYPGILRGAEGCFRSRAGNAWDRSLLLAELLRRAGLQSRFATGTLDPKVAEFLVREDATTATEPAGPFLDLPCALTSEEVEKERVAAAEAVEKRLVERRKELLAALDGALGAKARGASGGTPMATVVRWARQHVWIQVERGGKWVDLDPSFYLAEPGEAFASVERTLEKPPDDSRHRVAFRGFVERFEKGKVESKSLFESPHEAAALSTLPVVVECGRARSGAGGFAESLKGSHELRMTLRIDGVEKAAGKFEFDQPKKGGFGGLDFGGGGDKSYVVAVGVELVVTSPGEPEWKERRYLFDRWGFAARAASDAKPLQDVQTDEAAAKSLENRAFAFGVETGAVSASWLQWNILQEARATFESFEVKGGVVRVRPRPGDRAARIVADTFFHALDRASEALLDRRPHACGPRIALVIAEAEEGKSRMTFDVTRDPLCLVGEGLTSPHRTRLEAGLLSALAEEILTGDASPFGCARVLEDSLSRGAPKVVEKAEDLPTASGDATARMKRAIEAGRIVIVPEGQTSCWFELDPRTGELQAAAETGLHQAATEKAELESQTPAKVSILTRFGNLLRAIMRCVIQNIQSLLFAVLDAGTGGLGAGNAVDAAQGVVQCLAKTKGADPRNRAQFEEYKRGLRRQMQKPHAQDSKLSKFLDELYRPGAKVGSGSTADAIRFEKRTGRMVGGKSHTQKGEDAVKHLQDWLKGNPNARPGDRAAAENVLKDLLDALGG